MAEQVGGSGRAALRSLNSGSERLETGSILSKQVTSRFDDDKVEFDPCAPEYSFDLESGIPEPAVDTAFVRVRKFFKGVGSEIRQFWSKWLPNSIKQKKIYDLNPHKDGAEVPIDPDKSPLKGALKKLGKIPNPVPKIVNVASDGIFARLSKIASNKVSSLVSKIRFRRRPTSIKPTQISPSMTHTLAITDPGPFDIPIKKETYLYELLREKGNLDDEIANYWKSHHQYTHHFQPDAHKMKVGDVEDKMKENFKVLGQILKDAVGEEKSIDEEVGTITKGLHLSLADKYDSQSEAMASLAGMISAYKFKMLTKDQICIKSYLSAEQEYLTRLIGLFGPKNVLSPYVEEDLKTEQSRTMFPLIYYQPTSFFQQVEAIQKELEKLVGLNQDPEFAKLMPSYFQILLESSLEAIGRLERELIYKFGKREAIIVVFEYIEKLDIHQGFMREMNDPSSTHGLLIQLVEPWGYLRQYSKIPLKELPHEDFGILDDGKQILRKQLDERVAPYALTVIKWQLRHAKRVREAQNEIYRILSPEGLKDFAKKLKKERLINTDRVEEKWQLTSDAFLPEES
ncbi:hypothetical protein PCANC_00180 [Puccinia coronata f. sp. avenae]|uniref:Uncharacterized protein n=1 Tax=Puccinia coronata f. sp. avenae TaxID=200324 RepID=A0A2N5W8M2_9BASI|nr:hypothetical protein PCANC_00180 [Puccinia coronata f. sp. avenae]